MLAQALKRDRFCCSGAGQIMAFDVKSTEVSVSVLVDKLPQKILITSQVCEDTAWW